MGRGPWPDASSAISGTGEERGGEAPQAAAEGEHEAEDGGVCTKKAASRESLPLSWGIEGLGSPRCENLSDDQVPPLS